MIRLWGQAQFSIKTKKLSGYELFLREQRGVDGPWCLPVNLNAIDPVEMAAMLAETLAAMPDGLDFVAFNLDQTQFVQLEYLDLLKAIQAQISFKLGIELTERHGDCKIKVDVATLVEAAKCYSESGLVVCLDDVGTGENMPGLIQALDPYVSEYKYALQNVRGQLPAAQIVGEVTIWRNRARRLGKMFTLEGLEHPTDLKLIQQFAPDFVQGYYFGTPHFLATSADFAVDIAADDNLSVAESC